MPFSVKNVLKRENATFLMIVIAFTALEVVGDYFYIGKWQVNWEDGAVLCFGLVTYIVLLFLKKMRLLDAEGY